MDSAPQTPRRYRGIAASERRAQRHERFLEAGLELFGTQGYAGTSIRSLSAAASLNSRYFYESFTSREDLLYHVYRRIVLELGARAAEAVAAAEGVEGKSRAGLLAGWTALTEDPRKARVVALEVVGVSDRLERLRRENRHALADLTVRGALSAAPKNIRLRMDPILTARALMGGVVEVLADWINGDVDASVDEVVEHFTRLFTVAAYAAVAPSEPAPAGNRRRKRASNGAGGRSDGSRGKPAGTRSAASKPARAGTRSAPAKPARAGTRSAPAKPARARTGRPGGS